jgi:hypothetical protein
VGRGLDELGVDDGGFVGVGGEAGVEGGAEKDVGVKELGCGAEGLEVDITEEVADSIESVVTLVDEKGGDLKITKKS